MVALWVEVRRDLKKGAGVTTRSAAGTWRRSEGHSRRVLDWMASAASVQHGGPFVRVIHAVSPKQWERI